MENFRLLAFLGLIGFALSMDLNGSPNVSTIFIRHYSNGSNIDINIEDTNSLIYYFKSSKCFTLYFHGYTESVNSESVKTVVDAYMNNTNITVFAIDYSTLVDNNYLYALSNVEGIAEAVASAINKVYNAGVDQLECMHLVAHSLGAHISGCAAHRFVFPAYRLTALDPAITLFYKSCLNVNDAKFVDIIHTDAGGYGQLLDSGSVHFKPNYGHRIQPGCPKINVPLSHNDYCSHHRSWWYWAESIKNELGFAAVKCNSGFQFAFGLCNYTDIVPMGIAAPRNATGVYYLHTNAQSPFAKGIEGTRSNHLTSFG